MKEDKTNAMRLLDLAKIDYQVHIRETAKLDPNRIFKTLVTQGKTGSYYVFMLPINQNLDLKKAAKVTKEKSVRMIKEKDLLPLTGYVHGGCSPIGMKKEFDTFIDDSAILFETIIFSAGKRGCSIEMNIKDLQKMLSVHVVNIIAL